MSSEHRLDATEPPDDRHGPNAQTVTSDRTGTVLTRVTAVLGRKWHPVIVHRLLNDGAAGFSELESEIEGISSKMLSQALEDLEEHGLVDRTVINTKPFRVEYSLTEAGRDLEPVIESMYEWAIAHVDLTATTE
ncbi:winged helix-turn-helix transcriptional regulator [Natrialbaceae archaeon A-gly3]